MRGHRIVHVLRLILLCLFTPFYQEAAEAQSTSTLTGSILTISVPIDFYAFDRHPDAIRLGSAESLVKHWETEVERIWNDGLRDVLYLGCYTLKIDIVPAVTTSSVARAGHHHVTYTGRGFETSHVLFPRRSLGIGSISDDVTRDDPRPYEASATGQWGAVPIASAAHEVGHFLGLADDYLVTSKPGEPRVTKRKPGREGSIMTGSASQQIDAHLAYRLGDVASQGKELPACFKGNVCMEQEIESGGHVRRVQLELAVSLKSDEERKLRGEATGTFKLEGTVSRDCGKFSYTKSAQIQLPLEASGSKHGVYTISTTKSQKIEELQHHQLCGKRQALKLDWEISLPPEASKDILFEDGCYGKRSKTTKVALRYLGWRQLSPPSKYCKTLDAQCTTPKKSPSK